MRIRYLSLSVFSAIVVTTCAAFAQKALAMQIIFTETTQSRTQPQPQEGLSPEKKKSLSKYGPDDIFPGANEQEKDRARNSQSIQKAQSRTIAKSGSKLKRSAGKSVTAISSDVDTATTTVTPTPAIPTPEPSMSASDSGPAQQATPTPSPTINAAALNQQPREQQRAQLMDLTRLSTLLHIDVRWNLPILSALALMDFAALVYVLFKLREKIRVGSGG